MEILELIAAFLVNMFVFMSNGFSPHLLHDTYRKNINIAAIIYMHKIDDNRMSDLLLKNLGRFTSMCGQTAMPNVVMVTTMWSRVSANEGAQREQELKKTFWKDILDNGGRTKRFNGTYESAWGIIGSIMQNNTGTTVNIQQEMVDAETPFRNTKHARPKPSWKNFFGLFSR